MSWNYRVISYPVDEETRCLEVHEVYYNEDGAIGAITEKSVSPYGETEEEFRADMEKFQEALKNPMLKIEEIEFADNIHTLAQGVREVKQYELFEKKEKPTTSLFQQELEKAAKENERDKRASEGYFFLAWGITVALIFFNAIG